MECNNCGSTNLKFWADKEYEDEDGVEHTIYDVQCLDCGNFAMSYED